MWPAGLGKHSSYQEIDCNVSDLKKDALDIHDMIKIRNFYLRNLMILYHIDLPFKTKLKVLQK